MIDKLTDAQIGYIAGFFDGEGWISIVPRKSIAANKKPYTVYTLMIGAGQCDPRPIRWLQSIFTGSVSLTASRSDGRKKDGHPFYVWQVCSAKAERFLRLVQPLLIHKKEQCEVALSFRAFVTSRQRFGPKKAPPEYDQLSQEYSQLLKRVRAEARLT